MARTWTWFTEDQIAAWPDQHKQCRKCDQVKPFSAFHKNNNGKQLFGLASDCKECRKEKSKVDWERQRERVVPTMLSRAKFRAKKKGIPFDLSERDIVLPQFCPVFGMPFIVGGLS